MTMTKQNITIVYQSKLVMSDGKSKSSLIVELRLENLSSPSSLIRSPSTSSSSTSSSLVQCSSDIMDLDFRASFHSVKHLSAVQAVRLHSDNYSAIHYTDVDEDARSYFRCTFCDFEIVVPVPCGNVEEEHCSDLNNLVCPVCEENLEKDAIRQFTHSSSRKWMWKSEKSSFWSGSSAMLGKKLAARGSKQESIPDPLLSPFICKTPVLNANDIHLDEDSSSVSKDLDTPDAKRSGTDAADLNEQDLQERRVRTAFVQNLVSSTIF